MSHSRHIRDEFDKAGIAAAHVDAETDLLEREDTFRRFADGDLRVLCNYGVAVTGIDVPQASCCILARPTKSVVVYRQAVGRVMRPYDGPGGTKEHALLLDHAGCVLDHGFPDDDVEWSLEPSSRVQDRTAERRRDGKEPLPVACPDCATLFRGRNVCPACGHRLTRPPRKDVPHNKAGVLVEVERCSEGWLRCRKLRSEWRRALAVAAGRDGTFVVAAELFHGWTGQRPTEVPGLPHVPESSRFKERVRVVYPQFYTRDMSLLATPRRGRR